jgi:uncharacterized membrane protein
MSARRLRVVLIGLTVVGLGLASYLTYVHYAGLQHLLCGAGGATCAAVQSSKYSRLAGVSVAVMGLIGYFLILVSLLPHEDDRTRFATVALTLGGFGFSAYLTYREIFTLKKICEWCVSSAVLLTIMMGLSVWRFLRGDPDLQSRATVADDGEPAPDASATVPSAY